MNFRAMRYESTSLNRIAAEKSHHVPKALVFSRLGIKMVPCVIFLQLGSVQKV